MLKIRFSFNTGAAGRAFDRAFPVRCRSRSRRALELISYANAVAAGRANRHDDTPKSICRRLTTRRWRRKTKKRLLLDATGAGPSHMAALVLTARARVARSGAAGGTRTPRTDDYRGEKACRSGEKGRLTYCGAKRRKPFVRGNRWKIRRQELQKSWPDWRRCPSCRRRASTACGSKRWCPLQQAQAITAQVGARVGVNSAIS